MIYLAHPAEKGGDFNFVNNVFHGRLDLVSSYFSSEHFLYENRGIEFKFSIESASSFSTFNIGFSSKVFYKVFYFPGLLKPHMTEYFPGFLQVSFQEKWRICLCHARGVILNSIGMGWCR